MEDALVLGHKKIIWYVKMGLNPCFNGRCTRTLVAPKIRKKSKSLNPCFNGRCTRTS